MPSETTNVYVRFDPVEGYTATFTGNIPAYDEENYNKVETGKYKAGDAINFCVDRDWPPAKFYVKIEYDGETIIADENSGFETKAYSQPFKMGYKITIPMPAHDVEIKLTKVSLEDTEE